MLSSSNKQALFLGIDGGGTKCKAIIATSDYKILGSGIAGVANPLHGYDQAINSIIESTKLALNDAGLANMPLSELTAGVGLAGVSLPVLFDKMSNWQHPFKHMFLATDLLIACLGAHEGGDGAVIITGTGSCGFSYVDECSFMVGGHGFPHGDKGSGAWFGLQAIKQVLLSLDGLSIPSLMNDELLKVLQVSNDVELVENIVGKPTAYYAKLAMVVFNAAEAGDELAINIVKEGAEYISNVARSLWNKNPPRMSQIGGLTAVLQPWLDQEIKEKLVKPLNPPEIGSVIFAKQQLASFSKVA